MLLSLLCWRRRRWLAVIRGEEEEEVGLAPWEHRGGGREGRRRGGKGQIGGTKKKDVFNGRRCVDLTYFSRQTLNF